jgi:hypothetical protein
VSVNADVVREGDGGGRVVVVVGGLFVLTTCLRHTCSRLVQVEGGDGSDCLPEDGLVRTCPGSLLTATNLVATFFLRCSSVSTTDGFCGSGVSCCFLFFSGNVGLKKSDLVPPSMKLTKSLSLNFKDFICCRINGEMSVFWIRTILARMAVSVTSVWLPLKLNATCLSRFFGS